MTREENKFFVALGTRIATSRKKRGLTQTQLGDLIGVSQQQVVSFEKGRRKVPVSALPRLSDALGVSVANLLGIASTQNKSGRMAKLQRQLEQLQQLPHSKQRFVIEMLDTVLQQNGPLADSVTIAQKTEGRHAESVQE